MKLAIVGSRSFTNLEKVQTVLAKYIDQYGESLIVISGGAKGADKIGKDLAIYNGLQYVEFPPAFKPHNQYCLLPAEKYWKPYNVGHFFERNTLIAEYADHVAAFVLEGVRSNGTMDTVNKAKDMGKPVFIFTQK